MDANILVDLARYGHVMSVAVGFGAAFLADFHMLGRIGLPVDADLMVTLRSCHKVVTGALVAMWLTGLVMIGIRTGFVLSEFSPKLFSKLLTVAVLTGNAVAIGRYAMPIVERSQGRGIMSLPLNTKLALAAIGAVSSVSWMLAMAMGIIKVLATSGWLVFAVLLPVAYGIGIAAALGVMGLLHLGGVLAMRARPALVLTPSMRDGGPRVALREAA